MIIHPKVSNPLDQLVNCIQENTDILKPHPSTVLMEVKGYVGHQGLVVYNYMLCTHTAN